MSYINMCNIIKINSMKKITTKIADDIIWLKFTLICYNVINSLNTFDKLLFLHFNTKTKE